MLRYAILLTLALAAAAPSGAQTPPPPWKGENLRYFPADISREQLTQRMRVILWVTPSRLLP